MGDNEGSDSAPLPTAEAAPTPPERGANDVLLAEYNANVQLWRHDDDLRQKRTTTFITLNILLYAIVSWTIKESSTIAASWITFANAAPPILGILTCFVWFVSHLRNEQYIRFRRMQLIELEAWLGMKGTFENQYKAINQGQRIDFEKCNRSFRSNRFSRLSSSRVEYVLPATMAALWIVVLAFLLIRPRVPLDPILV